MMGELTADPEVEETSLFRAAEVMSRAGRQASRRALLQEAVRNCPDIEKARFWYSRAAARRDHGYIRDLGLSVALGNLGAELPEWVSLARDAADKNAPYSAAELRLRLVMTRSVAPSDRTGPLCYVLHMSLPENGTGYSVRSQFLIRAMQKCGLDPFCITRLGFPADVGQPSGPSVRIVDGVNYHRILTTGKRNFSNMHYLSEAAKALVEKLEPLRPRAIMAASNHENAGPALLAARHLNVPFIYEMRGFWELSALAVNPDHAKTDRFFNLVELEAELARQADLVFTLTDAMRGELRRRGVSNPAVHILPNAADPDLFMPRPRNHELATRYGISPEIPVIGYVGSFNPYEGLDDLVRACTLLHQRGYDFRLLLIGSEPTYFKGRVTNELQTIAKDGGIASKVLLPGRIGVNEVEQWYSLIDIVPIPRKKLSVTEVVSPLKPLEAMAMEKAVVVTDLPALKEIIIHQKTGLVVAHSDIAALASALADLIDNPDQRQSLGKHAREQILSDRNWTAVATKLRHVMTSTLQRKE